MYAKFTIQKIEILSGVLYTSAILAFGDGIFWCHIICCQQFQKRSNEVDLALKIFWYYINLHGPVSAILGFCSFSATFVQHTSILKSIISLQPPPPKPPFFNIYDFILMNFKLYELNFIWPACVDHPWYMIWEEAIHSNSSFIDILQSGSLFQVFI